MEFTVVSSHSGTTLNDHMESMKFVFVHPEFLIHMRCDSVEDYARSIVHASSQIDSASSSRMVREVGYLKNQGTLVFRHIRTMRTAILHFTMDIVLTNESTGKFVSISKISHIDWQKDDQLASWIGHVEAKLSLGELEHKLVQRDDISYISVPISKLPPLCDDVRDQLKILKCVSGVNVSYSKGTQRSLLIVKSLISPSDIEHRGYWSILSCGSDATNLSFLDASQRLISWLGATFDEMKSDLHTTISRFHTAAETGRIFGTFIPRCLAESVGRSFSTFVKFIVPSGVHDVNIVVHRLRSNVVIVFEVNEE